MAQIAYANRLLSMVAADEMRKLEPHLERVHYEQYTALIKPGEPIRDIVFPETCLASLVTVLEDGSTVEGGSVGREGMVGIPAILDAETTPMETLIQVGGDAVRIRAGVVKEVFAAGGTLRTILNRYIHTLFVIAAQSAACNRRHQVEQRLARWLLTSSDGVGNEEIDITHEFLATMLGVRRSGVTEGEQRLQEMGVIQTKRGGVRIIDRPRLEAISCECYRMVKNEYERLLS